MGNDVNPHFDNEEILNKEKTYNKLIENDENIKVSNSNIFRLNKNKSEFFDFMGMEEKKISNFENLINAELKRITNYIKIELPGIYFVENLIVS